MVNNLDHFIWAVSDLDDGIAEFADLTGVQAEKSGTHPGRGTRNALLALGDDIYLEILAPDPDQDLDRTFGGQLRNLERSKIFGYLMKGSALGPLAKIYSDNGVTCDGPFSAERSQSDGSLLKWELLIPLEPTWGACTPMFINWLDTPNPALAAPGGCRITQFEVAHPDAAHLAPFCRALDMEIQVIQARKPNLQATLETPKGTVILNA